MISLADFGFFARYTFDNRSLTSSADLKIGSDWVSWEHLRSTFEKVTGQKAEVIYQTIEEWLENFVGMDLPLAADHIPGDGSITRRENFTTWWALYRDEKIQRDWDWIRRVNPHGHTLEKWMREQNYGENVLGGTKSVLKLHEDGNSPGPDFERIAQL